MAEKMKILVVDDEEVIVAASRRILGAEGYQVRLSNSAETAMDMVRTETPDLMLLDLKLPEMSGMDLLAWLRQHHPGITVIVMTGFTTLENALLSLKQGAFDFLPKPFSFDELLGAVRRAGRFIALPAAVRTVLSQARLPDYHYLGSNTWARLESDGAAQLGLTLLFQHTLGHIAQVELPQVGEQVQQGGRLARLTFEDQTSLVVWSALSGRVIDCNPHSRESLGLSNRGPSGGVWLVRIIPEALQTELALLSSA